MNALLRFLAAATICALCASFVAAPQDTPSALRRWDASALEAYRAEDFATAEAHWREALEAPGATGRERARLYTNLGNAFARQDDWQRAAAAFEASLRLRPRDERTRAKRELARSEAGWPPADRGDLASTTERVLGALTEDEARWLALLGLLPLVACLAGEALRGGRAWRRASWIAAVVWLACTAPCVHTSWTAPADPVIVIAPGGAPARPEPRDSAGRFERLPSGSEWERLDALPGWTKLAGPEGRDVWVPSDDLFALRAAPEGTTAGE